MRRASFTFLLLIGHLSHLSATEPQRMDRYGDPLPDGAIARLGTTRFRPIGEFVEVAISGDSKVFATGEDRTIRLWEMQTGKVLWSTCLGNSHCAERLLISPDGKRLMVIARPVIRTSDNADDPQANQLYMLDMHAGRLLWASQLQTAIYSQFCGFVLGGKQFFIPNSHNSNEENEEERPPRPLLINAETGQGIRRLPGFTECAISPDGRTLAGATQHSIRLWNLELGREMATFNIESEPFRQPKWSGDGKTLAALGFARHRRHSDEPMFRPDVLGCADPKKAVDPEDNSL